MVKKITSWFEQQAFGVCEWWGDKLGISTTKIRMYFEDATKFDYSKIEYDMVLTSPPYYALEKYPHNTIYETNRQIR